MRTSIYARHPATKFVKTNEATGTSSAHAIIHARQQATRAATYALPSAAIHDLPSAHTATYLARQCYTKNTRAKARQHTKSDTCTTASNTRDNRRGNRQLVRHQAQTRAETGSTRGNKRTIIQARQHTARAATRMSSTHAATYAVPSAALRRYTVLIRVSAVSSGCYGVGPWPGHPGILP